MAEERVQRRLAAILVADVVGYSRLMGLDEAGTLSALKARQRHVINPLVRKHRGRIVNMMGDSVLVEFASAVNAVECATALQLEMDVANRDLPTDRHIVLRAGVNLGDVVVEGNDLYGDGINVAARLQALADPGSVLVSEAVFGQIRSKVPINFDDLGDHTLKNIAEPVRVYRIAGAAVTTGTTSQATTTAPKFSIAVLPFTNISGDPEQEYFSDGVTEDIITDLFKVSALKVISRNTVFTFKSKAVHASQVARQLGVAHVLEGSVRKAANRVRITAQLIDAADNSHLWAERYDRDLADIFSLQDEIAQAIVAALKIRLLPEEKKAIQTRSTHNPDAYQLYLLARHHFERRDKRGPEIAVRFCQRALEIDPNYARAWALIALAQAVEYRRGKVEESGLAAAEKALSIDPTLGEPHAAKGRVLAELGRYDEAFAAHETSLRLEPDSFDVRYHFGLTCLVPGRHEQAIEHFERAAQLLETDYSSLNLVAMN